MPRKRNALKSYMKELEARQSTYAAVVDIDEQADAFVSGVRELLREARKARGVSVTELAQRLQVAQPTISAIESGTGNLGLRTLARYLAALEVNLDDVESALRNASAVAAAESAATGSPDAPRDRMASIYEALGRQIVKDVEDLGPSPTAAPKSRKQARRQGGRTKGSSTAGGA